MTAAPLTPQDVFSTIPSDHRGTFVRLAEQRATAAAGGADPTPEQLCEAAKSIFAEIPEAARERFAKIAEQRAQLAAAASVRATAASLPSSPDQILRDAEAALAREQREEADETAWADARAKSGKASLAPGVGSGGGGGGVSRSEGGGASARGGGGAAAEKRD